MKGISARSAIIIVVAILAATYFFDFEIFKSLLTWTLGGMIVLLLNIAFFGDLIGRVMKNKDMQELMKTLDLKEFTKLLKEALEYLRKILENQKHKE